MSINWNNIRPLNNSRNDGFEELVCQLAAREIITDQQQFYRIGKPDAGKECFWELKNGGLHMWQAKYFTTRLLATQWTELDSSIKKAIDSHPKLVSYYVCIPIDRPDGKTKGQRSFLDKWKLWVAKWKKYAKAKRISLDIDFWGAFELTNKLAKRECEGLTYFWFNKEEFEDAWFEHKNNNSIVALGARYSADLNFDLPIAKIFDGIARDALFENQLHELYNTVMDKYRGIHIHISHASMKKNLETLNDAIKAFRAHYESLSLTGTAAIPFATIASDLAAIVSIARLIIDNLLHLREAEEKTKEKDAYGSRLYSMELKDTNELVRAANKITYFFSSSTCVLANHPFLLLTGVAGTGKSHLLADIIKKRKERKQQSLLLLGENFTTDDLPWKQILHNQLLKTQLDELVFLGALNAKAESEQSRLIIFIDAINEGNGRKVWTSGRLAAFLQCFEKFPWLGLVLSIRTSFEKLVAPASEITSGQLLRITHPGFGGAGYAVIKSFFEYYDIEQPGSPLLNPEFENPLFLKLYCKSLADRGIHKIPDGYCGISSIIQYYLESINEKLAKPTALDYDSRKPLVRTAVDVVLERMLTNKKDYLPYLEAEAIIDPLFRSACCSTQPFLQRLIAENVFNEDLYWDNSGDSYHVVYFAYQRFQDHLMTALLLDKYLDTKNPAASFLSGPLAALVKNQPTAKDNQNLIEALSIQLPERTGVELFEVVTHTKTDYALQHGFLQSLNWRKLEAVTAYTKKFVSNVIFRKADLRNTFLETAIARSMTTDFYYNAEWLHELLIKMPVKKRDSFWTAWLQNKYDRDEDSAGAIQRLVGYTWTDEPQSHVTDTSALLGCTTLAWFFTSANRYLRDVATKSLVCQLQQRLRLAIPLLKKFEKVNDPYVADRLYASVMGAVLRGGNTNELVPISEYVYTAIFKKAKVYPHILLRDYARTIITFSLQFKAIPSIDPAKVAPAYKSKPLPAKFPTNAVIDKKYKPKKKTGHYNNENWGATAILDSMTTEYGRGVARYGDFGRYTFQRALENWKIDCNGLSNYAVQQIFDRYYDTALFTTFDREQSSGNRERMGKKYQWLMFYELLAIVSDHYPLKDENGRTSGKTIPFTGPWYPYVRDIDPTMTIQEVHAEQHTHALSNHWWFNQQYHSLQKNHQQWITNRKNLPLPENIVQVRDGEEVEWIWLEIHPDWMEKEPLGEDRYHSIRKRLMYHISSCLLPRASLAALIKYFRKQKGKIDFPEPRTMHQLFDREYYWSPAFDFADKNSTDGAHWMELTDANTGELLAALHPTTEHFMWEEEFDCSKKSMIQFYKPAKIIYNGLGLQSAEKEGQWMHANAELVCFDPSVHTPSVPGLLIRKKDLQVWLAQNNLILCWQVYGEKQLMGNYRYQKGQRNRLTIRSLYTMDDTGLKKQASFGEEE